MKVCVLGTHSFGGDGPKVGTQHIAETLARDGHEVYYVTSQVSFLTLLSGEHRAKYLSEPRRLADRLFQLTPASLLPMRTIALLEGSFLEPLAMRLNRAVERTRSRLLERTLFDLCIFSAAGSMTLLPRIRARRYIYRHNDVLAKFERVPPSLLQFERRLLRHHPIWRVCSVNEALAESLRTIYPDLPIKVVPNGIDCALFRTAEPDPDLLRTRSSNVVFVGVFDFWTDVDLIVATASVLTDHSFHLFGKWNRPVPAAIPGNVHIHGPIRHRAAVAKMKACSVGLIPSGPRNAGRLVARPLKFYEYLAAGLGVAATSYAGKGLEPFAVLGDTPEALAEAILRAKSVPETFAAEIETALRELDWHCIVEQMLAE